MRCPTNPTELLEQQPAGALRRRDPGFEVRSATWAPSTLYQVATAALNPSDIASPIRRILRQQDNASVILAEAVRIDTKAKTVALADGSLDYDFLIVATGVTHSYFGRDDWSKDAPGLKTIEDALDIRRRVLLGFEAAERETDPAAQRRWLTFVVIGGGPTGVELAGALGEIARRPSGSEAG